MTFSEPLSPANSALVLVDFNEGLMQMLPPARKQVVLEGAIALSKIGKVFDLPAIVLGKGAEDNFGPLLDVVVSLHRDVPHPIRHTLSAWNTPEFVDALRATGRKKVILAGVATDLCVALLALDLMRNGYETILVADASGSQDPIAEQAGLMRLVQAGTTLTSWVGLGGELMRDWTLPQAAALKAVFDQHIPAVVKATAVASSAR